MSTALCVVALLTAETRRRPRAILLTKSAASLCFVLLGLVLSRSTSAFDRWIVVGLCCAALGDVCLALPGARAFQSGVLAFLAGHIAYVVAADAALGPRTLPPVALSVLVPSALAYAWLYPHLGPMRLSVTLYVLVISVMVAYAIGAGFVAPHPSRLFFAGAILFYASDLSVARDRFVKDSLINRLWGLPAYYAAQLLIAWSMTER